MSATSVKNVFISPAFSRDSGGAGDRMAADREAAPSARPLRNLLAFAGWRTQALEAFLLLALIASAQRYLIGVGEIPGLPHPYCLPVLLASCQYGMRGGLIAAVAASFAYFLGLSPVRSRGLLHLRQDGHDPARLLAGDGANYRRATQFAYASTCGAGALLCNLPAAGGRPQQWPRAGHRRNQRA